MSENRRNKRFKERKMIQTEKSNISKRNKVIWIGVIIIFILIICLFLFLEFLKFFIKIE